MAPARKRSAKAAAIPQAAIEQTITALEALPEKEKEAWSLREAVTQLQEPIRTALDRGYSYEEVTRMLADKGINISVFSLKRYLSLTRVRPEDGATNGRGKGKGRRTRKTTQVTEAEEAPVAVEAPAEVAPETEEAPKRRRKKTEAAAEPAKAAAKTKSTGRTRTTTRSTTTRGGRRKATS